MVPPNSPPSPTPNNVSHALQYNLSSLILQTEDGPHVRPKHVVVRTLIMLLIEVNIVVFDCVYYTRNSLPLYKETQRG